MPRHLQISYIWYGILLQNAAVQWIFQRLQAHQEYIVTVHSITVIMCESCLHVWAHNDGYGMNARLWAIRLWNKLWSTNCEIANGRGMNCCYHFLPILSLIYTPNLFLHCNWFLSVAISKIKMGAYFPFSVANLMILRFIVWQSATQNYAKKQKCSNDFGKSLLQKWLFPAGIEPTTSA